jgi:hypothetical protein
MRPVSAGGAPGNERVGRARKHAVIRAPDGGLHVRADPVRDRGPARGCPLLSLQALSTPIGLRLLGYGGDGSRSFRLADGAELIVSWQPADRWEKSYCRVCGSHLYTTNPEGRGSRRRRGVGGRGDDRTGSRADSGYTRTWSPSGDVAYATLSDGTRLRFLKTGSGRSALILLHTVRTQLDYFQLVIPRLLPSLTVYAVDLPGMGWSDITPRGAYTEPALRGAIVEFANTLGLEDVTLVGESMGATVS